MKKTLSSIVITSLMAVSSYAVTTPWGSNQIYFDGLLQSTAGDFTAYLVNVGGSSWASYIAAADVLADLTSSSLQTVGPRLNGGSGNGGKGSVLPSEHALSGNQNSYYGVIIVGPDGYYNFSNNIYQVPDVADNAQGLPTWYAQFTFGKNDINITWGEGGTYATEEQAWAVALGSTGTGWNSYKVTYVPVPEPATGAMALAGLALLFRRKRK